MRFLGGETLNKLFIPLVVIGLVVSSCQNDDLDFDSSRYQSKEF